MHSVRPDRPLPPLLEQLLARADRAVRELGLQYLVVGAFARDLVLTHVYGIDLPRPTRDIDLGIAVGSWENFERLKQRLVDTGEFSPVQDVAHRLRFRAHSGSIGTPLDIVPFSGVEEPDATIRWPPGRAVAMNVTGFEEALAHAELVRISDELTVPVASLPGLALLKLFAWLDRRHETSLDAVDLMLLMRHYGDAGNADRLYGAEKELLAAVDFDIERAGATLLGQDVRAVAMSRSYERLTAALAPEPVRQSLITHVASGVSWADDEDRVAKAETLVGAFFDGLGNPW